MSDSTDEWLQPEYSLVSVRLVTINEADRLYAEKKYTEAIAAYKTCIESGLVGGNEHKLEVYNRLGYAHESDGLHDLDTALEWYTRAIDLCPNRETAARALNNRGNIYWARNELELARADYDRAIALKPDSIKLHNRSKVYCELEQHVMELADLQRAVSLASDSKEIDRYTARIKEIQSMEMEA